jgi:transcription elongation factor Elf1
MLKFKSCPRCNGDVTVKNDWYGQYMNCLQCGWSYDTSDDPISQLAERHKSLLGSVAIKQAS